MEGKRTNLATTAPNCNNCPFQKCNTELCFEYLVCKAAEMQTSRLDPLIPETPLGCRVCLFVFGLTLQIWKLRHSQIWDLPKRCHS